MSNNSAVTLVSAIQTIRSQVNLGNIMRIDVRRDFILVDALREGKKKKFSAMKNIKV